MSGTPWWYSGADEPDEAPSQQGPQPQEPASKGVGTDWGSLLTGAQRIVDWATEAVMAPHAEHGDPREHPDCLICRALGLIGETGPASGSPDGADAASEGQSEGAEREPRSRIEWIPIREPRSES